MYLLRSDNWATSTNVRQDSSTHSQVCSQRGGCSAAQLLRRPRRVAVKDLAFTVEQRRLHDRQTLDQVRGRLRPIETETAVCAGCIARSGEVPGLVVVMLADRRDR
jgi:hypothetical protein